MTERQGVLPPEGATDIPTFGTLTIGTPYIPDIWQKTNNLRWNGGTLEQQWLNSTGKTQWEPVPTKDPTPEQLNALHALPDAMRKESITNWSDAPPDHYTAAVGQAAICSAMLRAALGAKPDDPPGNGLDDIRAAAMDQWGVPRAGEETAP